MIYAADLDVWTAQDPTVPCKKHEEEALARARTNLWKPGSVLWHAAHHIDDYSVKRDYECVLAAAANSVEYEVLREYARLRRKSPGWNPNIVGPNNHSQISTVQLARVTREETKQAVCEVCGSGFQAQRSTAKYCSGPMPEARLRQGVGYMPLSRNAKGLTKVSTEPPLWGENAPLFLGDVRAFEGALSVPRRVAR